jgi:hypothetical protein
VQEHKDRFVSGSASFRAAISLARLRRDNGLAGDARALRAPVHGWFTEGFDSADLIEAKALLDELRSARDLSTAAAGHLPLPAHQLYEAADARLARGLAGSQGHEMSRHPAICPDPDVT